MRFCRRLDAARPQKARALDAIWIFFISYFIIHSFLPKVESLKADVAKKNTALTAAETKLETLKAHQSNQQEHIGVLQTSIQTKEQHIKNLQGEVTQQWLLFSLLLL